MSQTHKGLHAAAGGTTAYWNQKAEILRRRQSSAADALRQTAQAPVDEITHRHVLAALRAHLEQAIPAIGASHAQAVGIMPQFAGPRVTRGFFHPAGRKQQRQRLCLARKSKGDTRAGPGRHAPNMGMHLRRPDGSSQ